MKYCYIEDGKIVKYNVDKPKVITSANKGIYLPLEDNMPTLSKYQKITGSSYNIEDTKVVKSYTLSSDEEMLQVAKDLKCKEIDSNTASKITNLVGSDVNQRNLTAKSSQLLLKKLNDDITDEELDLLNSLNDMFAQVEQWIIDGNALEQSVQELTTIEDVEAVEVT